MSRHSALQSRSRLLRLIRASCILMVALAMVSQAIAQDLAIAPRRRSEPPKIGLVLEGGGALGLAHIGVINWLEEHRIPVNYIAGTSMGGLVGGLYSTGLSAAEMRQVVEAINWDAVLAGQIPFSKLAFRRKEDAHDYPGSLEFGIRRGIKFPSGFNSGQQVSLILDRVAFAYSNMKSFDDLPIPFACVAVDLVSGKEHVFRTGSLSMAMRSTMSLPGIFTPVQSDGKIFADGGLLNNFPVSIAKDMGAQVVLGVHLETAPLNPDASLSSFGVMGRSVAVMIAANELRAIKDADLLVSVPLHKFTGSDYNQADEIIKAGYDAAAAKASVLSAFSVDEATWNDYLAARNARRRTAPKPTFITVTGTRPQLAASIQDTVAGVLGDNFNTQELDEKILTIAGMGRFSSLSYSLVERNGQQGLQIQASPKTYAPPVVRPLVLVDGSDYKNVLFSVGARVTFVDFGGFRSELRSDVILLGSQYGIAGEYYRPLTSTSRWFIAPRVDFNSEQLNVYAKGDLIAEYRQRNAFGGVDVGYEFGRSGELRLGYEGGHLRYARQIGLPTELPVTSGPTGHVRLRYVLNQLDNPVIPRSGRYLMASTSWYHSNPSAPEGFPLSEVQSQHFFRINNPSSLYFTASGGTSYGYDTGVPAFVLGGTQRLVAFGTNELLTNKYFLFQTGYIRELFHLPPLLGDNIDFVGMYELGKTYTRPGQLKPPDLPSDLVGAIVINTVFGPVEVGGAVGNYSHGRFFFRIGRIF